jgi:ADP-dependent NAD(P)H-hydrate dehydratase / NAD(P)H-hydrate epimerase
MNSILETVIVSAAQMSLIEEQILAAGMPVEALMEKAAKLCTDRIQSLYPRSNIASVGVLVGPGHNGGDALVIARELYLAGYQVKVYRPFFKLKPLTAQHANYAASLGITFYEEIKPLQECQLIIDGLFGFGLTRALPENIAEIVTAINSWSQPIVSIDLPSGIHTDTGEVLGGAIRATHTLCLGLWKLAFFQDAALEYLGSSERIDFGILPHHVLSVLPQPAPIQQITAATALKFLPLPRPAVTHKYQQGHLLLICGSRRYAGSAILTALGARASGVGMLSIAVPESLKPLLVGHLPEALIIDCPENKDGAIASLPISTNNLSKFDVVVFGPGLTLDAKSALQKALQAECPLILDADGLNLLAEQGTMETLAARPAPTILTPHAGEFKRLFPEIEHPSLDRITAVQIAARQSGAIVLFKGARTAIANPEGSTWLISSSTPALARGGSGDVLTGLMGGLLAEVQKRENKSENELFNLVATAAWWHSQAGILAAKERTELGVDAFTLSQYLIKAAMP